MPAMPFEQTSTDVELHDTPARGDLTRRTFQRLPIRLMNQQGSARSRREPFELSIGALHDEASDQTGLYDFGPDSYLQPLAHLVQSLNSTADLNAFGEKLAKGVLLQTLRNRLYIHDEWKRHGERASKPLRSPIMILGLPRSGTSLLFGLLARDRRHRYLADWETSLPVPPNSAWERNRWLRRTRWKFERAGLNFLAPRLRHIHELKIDGPAECGALLMNEFTYPGFGMMYRVPHYLEWLEEYDYRPAIRFYDRQLRLLQNLYPGERWLLKCPSHLASIDALLETYPDMCVVQTHRDPVEAIASECSLFEVIQGLARDEIDAGEVGRQVVRTLDHDLKCSVASRDRSDPKRFIDLHYKDVLRNPVESIRSIYDRFGFEWDAETEKAIRDQVARSPKAKFGVHEYALTDFGINENELRDQLDWYYERFDMEGARRGENA